MLRSLREKLLLGAVCLHAALVLSPAVGQGSGDYADVGGPTAFQKIMTSPFASLIMVLIGSAGLFNLFFASGKGEKSDRQQMLGLLMVFFVIGMCWYRFSLWNDPDFNSRPAY